jgi:hypothetical protein
MCPAIRALASPTDVRRGAARCGNLYHQGITYPATAVAAPSSSALEADDVAEKKAEILRYLPSSAGTEVARFRPARHARVDCLEEMKDRGAACLALAVLERHDRTSMTVERL